MRKRTSGLASDLGKWRLRGGTTFDRYDYEDATATSGARIDNRDRRYDLVVHRLVAPATR